MPYEGVQFFLGEPINIIIAFAALKMMTKKKRRQETRNEPKSLCLFRVCNRSIPWRLLYKAHFVLEAAVCCYVLSFTLYSPIYLPYS